MQYFNQECKILDKNIIENKFTDLILEFINFLRFHKYSIDIASIISCLRLNQFQDNFDKEEIFYSMKCLFVKTKYESIKFPELFEYFFSKKNEILQKNEIKKHNNELEQETQKMEKNTQDKIKEKIENFKSKKSNLSIEEKLIEEIIEENKIQEKLQCFFKLDEKKILNFLIEKELFEEVKQVLNKIMLDYIKQENSEKSKVLVKISQKLASLIKKAKEIEREYNKDIKEIEKFSTENHREEFKNPKNAVKLISETLNKDIINLNSREYEDVSSYIKMNANKFKTKLSRTMKIAKKKKFDLKKTIEKSIRTHGDVIEFYYKKPIIKKTRIVCLVDVSGSVSKYSKLLLQFVYELSNIFKGGVKSFAFVKEISDISEYLSQDEFNTGYEHAMRTIKREYSNYGYAFDELKNNYLGEFDKNTIFIILGDARNNRNASGEESLKIIKKKCKDIIWLVPEDESKWDTGDSYIECYQKIVKQFYETTTVQDIISFIEELSLK